MTPTRLHWISDHQDPPSFPPVDAALREPDGLLAAGGDLSPARLLCAYRQGIFPWYNEGEPVLWWSPDPRCVLRPSDFKVSRRLRRTLRGHTGSVTFNAAFAAVIEACAEPRRGVSGTWITGDMARAYNTLHREGVAHSVEVWQGAELVGGVYGLAIGRVFFGESMFSRVSNASKIALLSLCNAIADAKFELLDCQVTSPHLLSLGASRLSRDAFTALLREYCDESRYGKPFDIWPNDPISVTALAAGTTGRQG